MRKDGEKRRVEISSTVVRDSRGRAQTIAQILDITDRVRAEQALRESEQVHRQLVETLNEGIWRIDAAGYTTFVNPKMAAMLGYLPAEMLGRHLFDFVDPTWVEEAKGYMNRRRQGVVEQHEFLFRKRNGDHLYALVNTSPLFDEEGSYAGALAGVTDITARKQAEGALREREILFHSLFDQTFQLAGILAADGTVLAANQTALDFIGAHADAVVGRPFWDTPWWSHAAELRGWLRQAVARAARGEVVRGEVTHLSRQGELHYYFDFSLKPAVDEAGRVQFLIPESRDITERRQAELDVEHLNRVLRAIRNVNQLIVREQVPHRLIQRACQLLVETRGYRSAWIVLLDEAGGVVSAAEAGLADAFPDFLARLERGERPTCVEQVVRQAGVLALTEPAASCGDCPLAPRYGDAGRLAVRLEHDGRIYGLFTVTLPDRFMGEEEELHLFEEMSADIAFALRKIEDARALRKQRAKIAAATQLGELAWWEMELPSGRVTCDDRKLEMLGRDPAPFQGAHYAASMELVHPDDYQRTMQAMRDHLEGREPLYTVDYRMQTADGGWLWLHDQGAVIERHPDGSPHRVLGLVVNITERKQAEEALRASEQRYRLHFENVSDVIYSVDRELKLIDISPSVNRVLGYRPEELVGRRIQDLNIIAPEHLEQAVPDARRTLAGEWIGPVGYQFIARDGTRRSGEISSAPLHREGRVEAMVAVARDITDRVQAETDLRRSHAQLRKTLEGTIQVLAATVELRDPYTAGHQRRVAKVACAIAAAMGLPHQGAEGLRVAALIQDIGKISIPAELLSKPARLTELEFSLIKAHPQVAYDVISRIDFPWPVADIVLQHHERLDGSGYPQGLAGNEITLEARILAVADVVEAISSHRPYRPAQGTEAALAELEAGKGVLYDAQVVEACARLFREGRFSWDPG
ncbi:MAG: PAS domain S-box protein [Candidatus Bipolaricaulaceae bacterium]